MEMIWPGKLESLFDDRCTNAKVELEVLARPFRTFPQIARIPNGTDALDNWLARSNLAKLPVEILYYIAADVAESFDDLVKFASTCHLLWDISRPFIDRCLKSTTWAGSRIICIGEHACDLPSGILSDAEQATMKATVKLDDDYADESPLYYFSAKFFKRPADGRIIVRKLSWWWGNNLPGAVRAAFARMLPVYYKSAGKRAVLRNLSKKAFVRSEAVDALNKALWPDPKTKKRKFCLGDALMSRICWSSDPSRAIRDAERSCRVEGRERRCVRHVERVLGGLRWIEVESSYDNSRAFVTLKMNNKS